MFYTVSFFIHPTELQTSERAQLWRREWTEDIVAASLIEYAQRILNVSTRYINANT